MKFKKIVSYVIILSMLLLPTTANASTYKAHAGAQRYNTNYLKTASVVTLPTGAISLDDIRTNKNIVTNFKYRVLDTKLKQGLNFNEAIKDPFVIGTITKLVGSNFVPTYQETQTITHQVSDSLAVSVGVAYTVESGAGIKIGKALDLSSKQSITTSFSSTVTKTNTDTISKTITKGIKYPFPYDRAPSNAYTAKFITGILTEKYEADILVEYDLKELVRHEAYVVSMDQNPMWPHLVDITWSNGEQITVEEWNVAEALCYPPYTSKWVDRGHIREKRKVQFEYPQYADTVEYFTKSGQYIEVE